MVGVLDALGEEQAVSIGHDWGALVAWNSVLLHPSRFSGLVAMSVPYGGRAPQSPLEGWQAAFGDNFYYILYHQEPGVADAECDADPRGLLSRLYLSPDAPRHPPEVTDPLRSAGGCIPRLGAPVEAPEWLTGADLDYDVAQFEEAGFRGGVNYYRNFHRNWEITPQLGGDCRGECRHADRVNGARGAGSAGCRFTPRRRPLGTARVARGHERGDSRIPGGALSAVSLGQA